MKKIALVTATRAEYGLLAPVVRELKKYENDELHIQLIVTGTHLSQRYGNTIEEIYLDDIKIDHKISIPLKTDSEEDISYNQAETLVKFTKHFCDYRYDAVIVLGDRYETLAVSIAAGNTRTPIFHMCGGDTTEGAMDEWIRHSITKMSYLHFVTNEDSKKRVIQLGETPERVFDYGSTSIDNILNVDYLGKKEALESIGLSDCKYALCTYHPVTMESNHMELYVNNFLMAIRQFPQIEFILTKSNADQGGNMINASYDQAAATTDNLHVYTSLGVKRYLSLMKYSEAVIGNSSSGIIEAPALRVPTVNIGNRQRGRLQSESIINCSTDVASIVNSINLALSKEHKEICINVKSPYGDGFASKRIAKKTVEIVMKGNIDLRKKFYEI